MSYVLHIKKGSKFGFSACEYKPDTFSISCRACLLATHSLHICLSGDVLRSSLFLKDGYDGRRLSAP